MVAVAAAVPNSPTAEAEADTEAYSVTYPEAFPEVALTTEASPDHATEACPNPATEASAADPAEVTFLHSLAHHSMPPTDSAHLLNKVSKSLLYLYPKFLVIISKSSLILNH